MESSPTQVEIRCGDSQDVPLLLALFDEAIDWLVARGQTGQWGISLFRRPAGVDRVERLAGGGGLRIAERAGSAVGALVLGSAPQYVLPPGCLESYVLLLRSRRLAEKASGRA